MPLSLRFIKKNAYWNIKIYQNSGICEDFFELNHLGYMLVVGAVKTFQINIVLGFSCQFLHGSSCCLGCHAKPQLYSSFNERLKGQNHHTLGGSKASISEGFWTTSTREMDISAVQSCGSISSASTLHDACSSINPSEFINHGLLRWNQNRQKWVGNKRARNQAQQLHEPILSWNATYNSLLSNKKPFGQPIPLGEMVDFLVDIWEQEGMYD